MITITISRTRLTRQWRWTARAANHKIIATSGGETYHNLSDLRDTLDLFVLPEHRRSDQRRVSHPMTAVRNALQQRRPRAGSAILWFRCIRCNRLSYAEIIARECDPCIIAARGMWPRLGAVVGEMSGA